MGRTRCRVRALLVLATVATAVACCMPSRPGSIVRHLHITEFTGFARSAGPDDPLLWYRHTNATISEIGYGVLINGSDVYVSGAYAVNGIDDGLLVAKWTAAGQHAWTSRLNQFTTPGPNDAKEVGREMWCNGSGQVYSSGIGTALSHVNASGTITSLNTSYYDYFTDLDVNGSSIFVGGFSELGGVGYIQRFTLGGQFQWARRYSGGSISDVKIDGSRIVGLQASYDGGRLLIWNATGYITSNVSLGGSFNPREMARSSDGAWLVTGHTYGGNGTRGLVMKAWENGTVAWTRLVGNLSENTYFYDINVVGDYIFTCGYITHLDARGNDGYVGKWRTNGTFLWNYTWGVDGDEYVEGMDADTAGVYVTGQQPDTYNDLFLLKLRPDGRVPVPTVGKNVTGSPLSGDGVLFTAGGTAGDGSATRFWDFGDGTNSTASTPVHAFAAGGTYNVTLTVTDVDGSVGVASASISVVQDIAPAASFAASSTSVYTGTAVAFNYTGTTGNAPAAFLWRFGTGGPTNASQNATFTFAAAGTYNVSLAVTDADGDVGRASVLVTVVDRLPPPGEPPGLGLETIAGIAAGTAAAVAVGLAIVWHKVKKRTLKARQAP